MLLSFTIKIKIVNKAGAFGDIQTRGRFEVTSCVYSVFVAICNANYTNQTNYSVQFLL